MDALVDVLIAYADEDYKEGMHPYLESLIKNAINEIRRELGLKNVPKQRCTYWKSTKIWFSELPSITSIEWAKRELNLIQRTEHLLSMRTAVLRDHSSETSLHIPKSTTHKQRRMRDSCYSPGMGR